MTETSLGWHQLGCSKCVKLKKHTVALTYLLRFCLNFEFKFWVPNLLEKGYPYDGQQYAFSAVGEQSFFCSNVESSVAGMMHYITVTAAVTTARTMLYMFE